MRADSEELKLNGLFSGKRLRREPRNHCLPILEVFDDAEEPGYVYMVTRLLRSVRTTPFNFIDDVLEFVEQMLEVGPQIPCPYSLR